MKTKNKTENEHIIFSDEGCIFNKNDNWNNNDNLIVNVSNEGTTLKMPTKGIFNYSPNVLINGNFELTMDILMPEGSSFLSFSFGQNQDVFDDFQGWWDTNIFQKLEIKKIDNIIKYYLNDTFKGFIKLNVDKLYFQFRIFSEEKNFEFMFKNFKIRQLTNIGNENSYLIEKMDNMSLELGILDTKFNDYKKNTNLIIDSYQKYFNVLFMNYDLKPKKLLENTQTLGLELLNLIANICNKYNLFYWIDSWNLLGAVRHGGYVPWNDDVHIGMMRSDYEKLLKILPFELKKYDLDKIITARCDSKTNSNWINTFAQVLIMDDGAIFGIVNIFPYDFLIKPQKDFEKKYQYERDNHFIELINGNSRENVFKNVFKNLNLTYNKTNYVIYGIEHGLINQFDVVVPTEKIFPLQKIRYKNKYYYCPNDINYYLNNRYSNFMEIPKIEEIHSRQNSLKKKKNVYKLFEKYITTLKKINESINYSKRELKYSKKSKR